MNALATRNKASMWGSLSSWLDILKEVFLLVSMSHPSELWTWEKCKDKINTLPGRNGFPDKPEITFLGFSLDTETGQIVDALNGKVVEPGVLSYRSVSHTIFYVLSAYSDAQDTMPTGKPISSKQFRGNHFVCRGYTGETIALVKQFASEP